ncbi:MAG: PIN domain-containing protein [Candidatus Saccharimonas sp.]
MTCAGSLDANVLLRLLLGDIPTQQAAALKLLDSTTRQFAIADIAISEVVFVLSRNYRLSREVICEHLLEFLANEQFHCNRALVAEALPMYMEHPALSFEDCCLAVHAKLDNLRPLYTFDKKFAKQAPDAQLVG